MFIAPFTRTAQAQKIVSYEGPKFWNLLDNSLKRFIFVQKKSQ